MTLNGVHVQCVRVTGWHLMKWTGQIWYRGVL